MMKPPIRIGTVLRPLEAAQSPFWACSTCVILVVAVATAAYLNSLPNGFVYDDLETIVGNDLIRSWRNVGGLVSHRYFEQPGKMSYRPLLTLTYFSDYSLWRLNPVGYHAVNVALHALNAALVCWLAFTLNRRLAAGLVAGLFFGIHPVCSEVANGVSFREDALAMVFILAAVLFHMRAVSVEDSLTQRRGGQTPPHEAHEGHEGRREEHEVRPSFFVPFPPWRILRDLRVRLDAASRGWHALSLVCHALSLLAKEMGVVVLPLVFLFDLFRGRRVAARWRVYLGYAALTVGYLILRFGVFYNPAQAGLATQPVGVPGACQVVAEYIRLMLFPLNLTPDHLLKPALGEWACVVIILALIAAAFAWRHGPHPGGWALMWVLVALAPASGLVPLCHLLAERRAYVAVGGLCLVLIAAVSPRRGALAWACLALAVLCTALTVHRNGAWRNTQTLWSQAVLANPGSYRTWTNLSGGYDQRGQFRQAVATSARALALAPDRAETHLNLGLISLHAGDLKRAESELRAALDRDPKHVKALKRLADVRAKAGATDEAMSLLRQALTLSPTDGQALNRLGCLHLQAGSRPQARQCFEAAVKAMPDLAEAHSNLGSLLWQEGHLDAAMAEFRLALALDPETIEASYNLACVAWQRGLTDEAARHFQRVLESRDAPPAQRRQAREALQALRPSAR